MKFKFQNEQSHCHDCKDDICTCEDDSDLSSAELIEEAHAMLFEACAGLDESDIRDIFEDTLMIFAFAVCNASKGSSNNEEQPSPAEFKKALTSLFKNLSPQV